MGKVVHFRFCDASRQHLSRIAANKSQVQELEHEMVLAEMKEIASSGFPGAEMVVLLQLKKGGLTINYEIGEGGGDAKGRRRGGEKRAMYV